MKFREKSIKIDKKNDEIDRKNGKMENFAKIMKNVRNKKEKFLGNVCGKFAKILNLERCKGVCIL